MNTDSQDYYRSYEDRYRRVYAQGVEYWSGDPNEIATVIGLVEQFLHSADIAPASGPIVELGCGEGFLGEYLLRKGYSYTGVDISPSALDKARKRLAGHELRFVLGDVTNLSELQTESFVATLDNYCLHMLVTDVHREKYLAETYRVLKPGGHAWFHEIGQTDQFGERIRTFDDLLAAHPVDLGRCEDREAYTPAGKRVIQLPRLPARFTNREGYRQEIERAGFELRLVAAKKSGIIVHARRPGGGRG